MLPHKIHWILTIVTETDNAEMRRIFENHKRFHKVLQSNNSISVEFHTISFCAFWNMQLPSHRKETAAKPKKALPPPFSML